MCSTRDAHFRLSATQAVWGVAILSYLYDKNWKYLFFSFLWPRSGALPDYSISRLNSYSVARNRCQISLLSAQSWVMLNEGFFY